MILILVHCESRFLHRLSPLLLLLLLQHPVEAVGHVVAVGAEDLHPAGGVRVLLSEIEAECDGLVVHFVALDAVPRKLYYLCL